MENKYQTVVEWMFKQLPFYQNQGIKAYKKDLTNSLDFDSHLNHPHKNYPTIHVAGTNGKGTTCHLLAAALQTAGYKVGLYTSPHLKDFRERIKINGTPVSEGDVIDFIEINKPYLETKHLSFFEMTVGMAFTLFKKHRVDVAIIEVGLGGRLDSTNIITPLLSVITSIDKDHTDLLGKTLEKIAREKAGIIKPQVPVVINENRPKLRKLFKQIAREFESSIDFAFAKAQSRADLPNTEIQNKALARLAISKLNESGAFQINKNQLTEGFEDYQNLTGFQGRYQRLDSSPITIADVAHNPAGLSRLFERIGLEDYNKLHLVFGVVKGKNLNNIIDLMPKKASYYLCAPRVDRRLPVTDLEKVFAKADLSYSSFSSVEEAFSTAKKEAKADDLILVTGSNFIVGEIL